MRVAIIGGGIIGCATAYYLSRTQSCEITVIEAEGVASGASGYSAGILTPYSGSNDPGLLSLSPKALELHAELAQTLPDATGIDHGYDLRPFLRCAFGNEGLANAQSFMNDRQSEGLTADWLNGEETRKLSDQINDDVIGACVTEIEPTVDSASLTRSLLKAAADVEIVSGRVIGIHSAKDGSVASVNLRDDSHLSADAFVFAIGPWSASAGEWLGFNLPVVPQKGQLLHIDLDKNSPEDSPPVGMQNMDDGGVILPRRVSSTVLGATRESHGFDRTPSDFAYDYILPRVKRISSRITSDVVSRQTACLRPMPDDGKPYVGLAPGWDNAYIACGHWSEGVHFGPLTGKLIADIVTTGTSDIDSTAISTDRLTSS